MLELGVKFLISYLLGSVMGSLLMGRIAGGVDIRTMGSGNAGGTNALRTQGFWFALGVVVVDVGKGALAAGVVPGLALPGIPADPAISRTWLALCCAAGSVIGHVWPLWHSFRGGKGAATLVGTIAVLAPVLLLPILGVWVVVLVLFGFVGLATMCGAAAAPAYLAVTTLPQQQPLFIYCLVMAAYLVFSHRSNIQRMLAGNEHRNPRVMILRRRRS